MNAKKHAQQRRRNDPKKYWQKYEIEAIHRKSAEIEALFGPPFSEEELRADVDAQMKELGLDSRGEYDPSYRFP